MTQKEKAEALAKRLGVEIPDSISIGLWPLPLLEVLVDRLEKLEECWQDQLRPVATDTDPIKDDNAGTFGR